MGFASLLWPQGKGRWAGYRASRTDYCAGPAFRCFFISAPLCTHVHVGGCIVIGTWWTGYDGANIMTFPWTRWLLFHGCSLKRGTTGMNQLRKIRFEWCLHLLWECVYLCYDPLLSRLLTGNEVDGAPRLLHCGHDGLSALHLVRKWTRPTGWGALSLHLLWVSPQVTILSVQMTRYT